MKICKTCGLDKPLGEYYKRSNGSVYIHCKKCFLDKYSPNRGKPNLGKYQKGNIPFTRKEIDGRQSLRAKQWGKDVKARDNYACITCGATNILHAHHIKDWYLFPEFRFELSNGITLCNPCHSRLHGKNTCNFLKNGTPWCKGKKMSLKHRMKLSRIHKKRGGAMSIRRKFGDLS